MHLQIQGYAEYAVILTYKCIRFVFLHVHSNIDMQPILAHTCTPWLFGIDIGAFTQIFVYIYIYIYISVEGQYCAPVLPFRCLYCRPRLVLAVNPNHFAHRSRKAV